MTSLEDIKGEFWEYVENPILSIPIKYGLIKICTEIIKRRKTDTDTKLRWCFGWLNSIPSMDRTGLDIQSGTYSLSSSRCTLVGSLCLQEIGISSHLTNALIWSMLCPTKRGNKWSTSEPNDHESWARIGWKVKLRAKTLSLMICFMKCQMHCIEPCGNLYLI